jgi:hypothetical protein
MWATVTEAESRGWQRNLIAWAIGLTFALAWVFYQALTIPVPEWR